MSDGKRKYQGNQGKGREGKRMKWSSGTLEPGMVGFFLSCTKGKERQAFKEMAALLMEVIQSLYPTLLSNPTSEKAAVQTSIEDSVANEISELSHSTPAADHGHELLHPISLGVDCLIFIHVKGPQGEEAQINLVEVATTLFRSILQRDGTKRVRTRFAQRLIPFQATCKSYVPDLQAAIESLVQAAQLPSNSTFALHPKIRQCSRLDRDVMIEDLASPLIAQGHKVNLTRPSISIIIEIIRGVAGVSLIPQGQYVEYRKFNLPEVYVKGKEAAATDPSASAEEKTEQTLTKEEALVDPVEAVPAEAEKPSPVAVESEKTGEAAELSTLETVAEHTPAAV